MCLNIKKIKHEFKEKNNVGYKVIYENNYAYYISDFKYIVGINYPTSKPNHSKIRTFKCANGGMLHVFLNYKDAKHLYYCCKDILDQLGKIRINRFGKIKIIRVYFDKKNILYKGIDGDKKECVGLSKLRIYSLNFIKRK